MDKTVPVDHLYVHGGRRKTWKELCISSSSLFIQVKAISQNKWCGLLKLANLISVAKKQTNKPD